MIHTPRTNKPYALKGQGPRIVEMRDKEGRRFEEIAVLYGASVNGIRYAYNREKRKAPTGDTEGATNHPEGGPTNPEGGPTNPEDGPTNPEGGTKVNGQSVPLDSQA